MNYYASLAFRLRLRQLPESRVAEILREVRDLSRDSGQSPQMQFGSPEDYAAQFPKGKTRSLPTRIAIGVLCAAIVVMAISAAINLVADKDLQIGGVPVILALLAVEVTVVVAAIVAEHRLPREFLDAQTRP